MAKVEKAEMVKSGADALMNQANKVAALSGHDQLRALQAAMDLNDADVEIIAAGKLPFWPALAGAMIVGTIVGYDVRQTRLKDKETGENMSVGVYTFQVDRPTLAGNSDGEVFEAAKGDVLTVLERKVIEKLRGREGQKVGILCLGKVTGSNGFDYYDYKIVGFRRQENGTTPQLESATPKA